MTATQVTMVEQGVVVADVPCVGCGYNLRGLSKGAACPECGRDIARSLRSSRLVLADPAWLRCLLWGTNWILLGFAFGLVMLVLLGIVQSTLADADPLWQGLAVWGFAMPPGLVILWGCWRLTAPEPGRRWGWRLDFARPMARYGAVTVAAMAVLVLPLSFIHVGLVIAAMGVAGLAVTAAGFAALWYGRSLAWRIPDRLLAVQAVGLTVLYGFLAVAAIAGPLIGVLLGIVGTWAGSDDGSGPFASNPAPPASPIYNWIAIIAFFCLVLLFLAWVVCTLLCVVAGLWTLVVGIWFRQRFAKLVAIRSEE